MSSLTAEVKDRKSPVAAWLSTTFPDFTEVQKEFRDTAGTQRIHPPAGVVAGTQGAASDFWRRIMIAPQPAIAVPLIGLLTGRAPCIPAGKELLDELAAGVRPRKLPDGEVEWRMRPADFAARGDEWWARVCYALALLVELYRAATVDNSRLQRLDDRSRGADLLELALDVEVTDLIAMRDLARQKLVPALPAGPVSSGMTFDGSADLNADADLIAGGVLTDFKAARAGRRARTAPARPRSAATRSTSCSATR